MKVSTEQAVNISASLLKGVDVAITLHSEDGIRMIPVGTGRYDAGNHTVDTLDISIKLCDNMVVTNDSIIYYYDTYSVSVTPLVN